MYNEKATKDSVTPDKWFKTGDIAVRDEDGFFKIVDRKKELIKYKGWQGTFFTLLFFLFLFHGGWRVADGMGMYSAACGVGSTVDLAS